MPTMGDPPLSLAAASAGDGAPPLPPLVPPLADDPPVTGSAASGMAPLLPPVPLPPPVPAPSPLPPPVGVGTDGPGACDEPQPSASRMKIRRQDETSGPITRESCDQAAPRRNPLASQCRQSGSRTFSGNRIGAPAPWAVTPGLPRSTIHRIAGLAAPRRRPSPAPPPRPPARSPRRPRRPHDPPRS